METPADEHWARVKDVVADALDLAGVARLRFLDEACDESLRAEVDRLLIAFEDADEDDFLDDTVTAVPLASEPDHERFKTGDHVGPRLDDEKERRGVARALADVHALLGNTDAAAKWRTRAK